ncbi:MAG TPA: hypothetical protein VGH28_29010 [Polyangiaceae bacterium]|jgi:hypothetical protein
MATLLTNRRMAPELRERVERSVAGRTTSHTKPARFRAILRFLFLISVIATIVWTFSHNRVAARELERRRSALLSELRTHGGSLDVRARGAIAEDEKFLHDLAGPYEGDVAAFDFQAPGALAQRIVYVRGPIEAFTSGASIQNAAGASLDEAFVRCLLDPPRSRKERDVLSKARAVYAATAPLPNVYRLYDAYAAHVFLQPAFEARVRAADEHELTTFEKRVERARLGQTKSALAAQLLVAVLDEPGDLKVPADLDGERPHDVRVAIVDLAGSKVLFRARRHVDPSGWSEKSRVEFASAMDSCALAYDLHHP